MGVNSHFCFGCGEWWDDLPGSDIPSTPFSWEWDTFCHAKCCPAFTGEEPTNHCKVCDVYARRDEVDEETRAKYRRTING